MPGRGLHISLEVGMRSSTTYSRAERKLIQSDCKEKRKGSSSRQAPHITLGLEGYIRVEK